MTNPFLCAFRVRAVYPLVVVAAMLAAPLGRTQAQETPLPAVPTAQSSTATHRTAVLDRAIDVKLVRVSLRDAIQAISVAAGVPIAYGKLHVPVDNIVSLEATHITVRDALAKILADTDLEVYVSDGGVITLGPGTSVSRSIVGVQQGTATVSGYVRDSATGAAIPQATVRVDGTTLEAKSNSNGRYQITGMAAGEYRLTARRVGYLAAVRAVTLIDDQNKSVDFGLNPPATKLDEVVTTALGDQRRYTVGNVISTINVDSLAPTTPVTSLTDLIAGRAPGVNVVENSGLTGSGDAIRIRGQSSMALQGNPIVIVDGVRQDNSAGGAINNVEGSAFSPSRINDIAFTQVETIDILKGPAAATEYGTDAANGVIVITTKRGVSGAPQWQVSAEQDPVTEPMSFPNYYYAWGQTTGGAATPIQCTLNQPYGGLAAQYGFPYNVGGTAGNCVTDSVTAFNPMNHSAYSIFGTGMRAKYDLSLGGGSDVTRYFVAGSMSNETGMTRLPPIFDAEAVAIGFPSSLLKKANTEVQRSVRANTTIRLGTQSDVTVSAAYLATNQQTIMNPNLAEPTGGGEPPDSANSFGYANSNGYGNPLSDVGEVASQLTNRLTGGLALSWRPMTWLTGHGTVGIDHGAQTSEALVPSQVNTYSNYGLAYAESHPTASNGDLFISNGSTNIYSGDFRATATASITSQMRAITSLGLQFNATSNQSVSNTATGVSASNQTLNGYPLFSTTQSGTSAATLGGYVEEQLGFADRLFLTGAVRVDAGSGFGSAYNVATYPKVSASWLAVTNGSTSARLRAAYGANGQQPENGAALQLSHITSVYLNGTGMSANTITAPGNPLLQPERSVEMEGGADVSFFANRLTFEFTAYQKTTQKALVEEALGFDLDNWTAQQNIGQVLNTGMEGTLTGRVFDTRAATLDMTMTASLNRNKLQHILPGVVLPQYSGQRQVVGYPLYGYWGVNYQYSDANRDGIISPDEVTLDTLLTYKGSSLPTRTMTLGTHLGLWRGALTLGALLDYASGYKVFGEVGSPATGSNIEENYPGKPLWEQARDIADFAPQFSTLSTIFYQPVAGDFVDGTYLSFRELSLTYSLSRRMAHWARLQSLSVTAGVRNLALWTALGATNSGFDPEVTRANTSLGGSDPVTGQLALNNDVRANGGSVPLARYWMMRLNIGL